MPLLSKVGHFMEKHQMLKNGSRILVGLSGGADSVALMCLLHQMAQNNPEIRLFAVHVNHMLRKQAGEDEAFCRKLCEEKNIPFYAAQTDVAEVSRREHLSLEEAGRQERYQIFERYREELSCDVIATAHHKGDVAETVLLRILRGCGPEGLKGILPVRQDGVIRPLLDCSKEEILDYLRQIGQHYVTDETNLCCDYARNKIRNRLIPLLEKEYNPEIQEALCRLSVLASEDCSYLDQCARDGWDAEQSNQGLILDRNQLLKTAPAIRSRILQRAYERISGSRLDFVHLKGMEELLQNQTGKRLSLPGQIVAETEYDSLVIRQEDRPCDGFCFPVTDGFDKTFPEAGFRIKVILSDKKAQGKNILSVPADGETVIRSRKTGDRIKLPGTDGSKKIKDIMIDNKISRRQRDVWPLVVHQGEIVWMAGFYQNRIQKDADQYYIITMEKTGENTDDA